MEEGLKKIVFRDSAGHVYHVKSTADVVERARSDLNYATDLLNSIKAHQDGSHTLAFHQDGTQPLTDIIVLEDIDNDGNKWAVWDDEAIKSLIMSYTQLKTVREGQSMSWKLISENMEAVGKFYLPRQCREKWRRLLEGYNKLKINKLLAQDWKYFEMMRSALGHSIDENTFTVEDNETRASIKWTTPAIFKLIEAYQEAINLNLHNSGKQCWIHISLKLLKNRFRYQPLECELMYKRLMTTYRSHLRRYVLNKSRIKWIYFNAMNNIMHGAVKTCDEVINDDGEIFCKWPIKDIKCLIKLYKQKLAKQFSGKCSVKEMWKEISEEMNKLGKLYNPSQCHSKYRGLKRTYVTKTVNLRNDKARSWLFFHDMKNILEEEQKFKINTELSEDINDGTDDVDPTCYTRTPPCTPPTKKFKSEDKDPDSNDLVEFIIKMNEQNEIARQRRHKEEMDLLQKFIDTFQENGTF